MHAARLHDGRAVAVKIQYPGVAAAIHADLKNTELLATFLGLMGGLSPRKLNSIFEGAAQEMGERITEELDYRLEAANQAEFAELYRGHPFIHVPEVIGELCTDRVLTQELVQGKSWNDALAAGRSCETAGRRRSTVSYTAPTTTSACSTPTPIPATTYSMTTGA